MFEQWQYSEERWYDYIDCSIPVILQGWPREVDGVDLEGAEFIYEDDRYIIGGVIKFGEEYAWLLDSCVMSWSEWVLKTTSYIILRW